MKRYWIVTLTVVLAVALLTGVLTAEEGKDRPKPKRGERVRRGPRKGGGPRGMPDIGLTDAQKAEIKKIREAAMAEAKKVDPKDRRAIFEKMKKDIHALFTEEQLEKLKKAHGDRRGRGRGGMPDIGLSEDQKKAIAEIRKAAMAEIKKAKPEERRAIFEKMRKDIEALLTKEQIEKMKKARQHGRGRGGMPDVGLTDEQKAEIKKIREAAMAKAKEAKPEERRAIFEEMRKAIHDVFTEEQLEKLKKARKDGPPRRGGDKGRRRGPKGKGDGERPRRKRPKAEE